MTRRWLIGLFASLFAVRASAQTRVGNIVADSTFTWTDLDASSLDELPDDEWEMVYKCPAGHESIMYRSRDGFSPPNFGEQYSDFCNQCYIEWLRQAFPPAVYVGYRAPEKKVEP